MAEADRDGQIARMVEAAHDKLRLTLLEAQWDIQAKGAALLRDLAARSKETNHG